jgi:hypothetical protein
MKTKHFKSYRFIVALFMASVLTLGFAADNTRVFAIPDLQFYSGNRILYYDPDSGLCEAGGTSLRGGSTEEKIWNYLVDKGLSPEQAAGIMGNMYEESKFSPLARQSDGDLWDSVYKKAWGLVQWDGGRRYTAPKGGVLGKLREKHPDLVKYTTPEYDSADSKVPAKDLDTMTLFQLDYMYGESIKRRVTADGFGSGDNEWEVLKLQTTVARAALYWHANFEVSDDKEEAIKERITAGNTILKKYSANTGKVGTTVSTECGTAPGNLGQTTLLYAHPQYHPDPYLQRMPKYTEAVDRAKKDGRYTGDPCSGGGVDCGAFVTILLNDSGFDPAYNHNGKGGFTGVQKAWAEKNWKTLGKGNDINVADLRPGDVAHKEGHTFLFVGKDIPGFGEGDSSFKGVASASQCQRAPMAGHESMTDSDVTWYQKR